MDYLWKPENYAAKVRLSNSLPRGFKNVPTKFKNVPTEIKNVPTKIKSVPMKIKSVPREFESPKGLEKNLLWKRCSPQQGNEEIMLSGT